MTQLSVDDEKKIDFDQLKLWCSNLKTGSKKDKIQNLERIEDLIKSGLVDETNIQEIYDQIYLHLLQLYSDKSEVGVWNFNFKRVQFIQDLVTHFRLAAVSPSQLSLTFSNFYLVTVPISST